MLDLQCAPQLFQFFQQLQRECDAGQIDAEVALQAQRDARPAQRRTAEAPLGGVDLNDADHSFLHQLFDVMLIDGKYAAEVPDGEDGAFFDNFAGQGARPLGEGVPGDLYIEVEFQPHPLYRIDGRDLYLDLPVAPWEAALGATVKTPTPNGDVELKIPAGSHTGSKLRLKGRGIPSSPPGDFYVALQIAVPPAGDEKAKAAYRAFAAAVPFNPRANLGV